MASRDFSSHKDLKISVEDGQFVTLELNVRLTFALASPVPIEQEMANAMRLMNSELRHRVADELERTWLGPELDTEPGPPDPDLGQPGLDIGEEPTASTVPEAETGGGAAATAPPAFAPNRRGSQQARTRPQQIVLHLEGPRYGFRSDQRADRLAFTAWLTEVPGLKLTSTNDLTPDLAQRVLARINREPDAAHLLAEWRAYGLGLEPQADAPLYEQPLGF